MIWRMSITHLLKMGLWCLGDCGGGVGRWILEWHICDLTKEARLIDGLWISRSGIVGRRRGVAGYDRLDGKSILMRAHALLSIATDRPW